MFLLGFPGGTVVKNLPANAGDARDVGSIPGSGRSPGGGNGNPLQYSCLGNPIDRGAWRATVPGVTKSQTRLSDWTTIILVNLKKKHTGTSLLGEIVGRPPASRSYGFHSWSGRIPHVMWQLSLHATTTESHTP